MGKKIQTHQDLEVYQRAFDAAIQIFELSKTFPKEETYCADYVVIESTYGNRTHDPTDPLITGLPQ